MKMNYPVRRLCLYLKVSPSGFYDWEQRQVHPCARALENQSLAQEIDQIHTRSRKTYGAPRVEKELRKKGRCHGRNRVARLMKEKGLCGRQKGRYHVQTTDSNHDEPIAPNRLAEAPKATAPNQLWVADITYIETKEGWLYLAAILDLYSRKIVGWAMSERIDSVLVLNALAMALLHRRPPARLLFHTDRGVQYASADYRQALGDAGLIASMSRRANCYDNATMESFWATLKLELVYRRCFDTRAQARSQIFDYIETFYNRQRAHSALNYQSPVDFELQNNYLNDPILLSVFSRQAQRAIQDFILL
jgi:transposase InsO family protein